MSKNHYSVSGTYGDAPKTLKVGFTSNYELDSAIEPADHIFNVNSTFPELSEYSKVNAGNLSLGLPQEALSFSSDAQATIKMVQSGGLFKNVLGYYTTAPDGTIRDVSIAFNNTRATESGITHSFDVDSESGSVNFFLVANGYNLNKFLSENDIESGDLSFIYRQGSDDERLAKITDNAEDVTFVYQSGEGAVTPVRGPVYHATEHGSDHSNINSDGDVHVVSGLAEHGGQQVMRIGFEDFPGLGDADFNDVVFDISASYLDPTSTAGMDPEALSNIEPAGPGDKAEGINGENQSQSGTPPFGGPSSQSDGGYSGAGGNTSPNSADPSNFIVYLADKMSSLLPDLYGQVKQEIYNKYGDAMYDNYEQLFADYVQENYEHIYNEIKTGFYESGYAAGSSSGLSVSYDDMIDTADHVDESISNFINLGTIPDQVLRSEGLPVENVDSASEFIKNDGLEAASSHDIII